MRHFKLYLVAVAIALSVGCGGSPKSADPDAANGRPDQGEAEKGAPDDAKRESLTSGSVEPDVAVDPCVKYLQRWVGNWNDRLVAKSGPWAGPGESIEESIHRVESLFGGRFLRGVVTDAAGRETAFWIMAYDPGSSVYRYWYFNPIVNGIEYLCRSDSDAEVMQFESLENEMGFAGKTSFRFADPATIEWKTAFTSTSTEPAIEMEGLLSRRDEPPPPSPQMDRGFEGEWKLLQRWIGNWDSQIVQQEPRQGAAPETLLQIRSALGGSFLHGAVHDDAGAERSAGLLTYDPRTLAYRVWYFDPTVISCQYECRWDASNEVMTCISAKDGDALTETFDCRLLDRDTIEWHRTIKRRMDQPVAEIQGTLSRRGSP